MKFCINCGTQLEDNVKFCGKCGTAQPDVTGAAAQTSNTGFEGKQEGISPSMGVSQGNNVASRGDSKKKRNRMIGLIAVLVVLAAIIISTVLILKSCGGSNNHETPIKNMCTAFNDCDAKKLFNCFPQYVLEDIKVDDFDKDDWKDSDEELEDLLSTLEDQYGDHVKMSYDIRRTEKMDKSDLDDLEDQIDSYYDEDVSIQEGYIVKTKLTISGDDDKDSNTEEIQVIKIDGKWYLGDGTLLSGLLNMK